MPLAVALALLSLLWLAAAPARAAEPKFPLFADLGYEMTEGRQGAVAAPLPDGRVLITGGVGLRDQRIAETFDPQSFTFSALPKLARYKRSGAAGAALPGGRVLIAGGSHEVPYAHAEIFDPDSEAFTDAKGEMTTARLRAVAAPLPDGRVLITGGFLEGKPVDSAEVFDPATETFAPLAAAPLRYRSSAVAVALEDGRVLIAGGDESRGNGSAEVFDPATGSFAMLIPDLGRPFVGSVGVALPSGEVLLAGGIVGGYSVRSAGLLDPKAATFTPLPNSGGTQTTVVRWGASAALLPDGKVLISGGAWPEAERSSELFLSSPSIDASGGQLGPQLLGATATADVVIRNLGAWSLEIDSVALDGADASSFAILGDSCAGAKLYFKGTCVVRVAFTPTRVGAATATLRFDDNEPTPTAVPLSASGIAPAAPPLIGPPSPAPRPLDPRRATSVKCSAKPIARSKRVRVICRTKLAAGAWEARLASRNRTLSRRQVDGAQRQLEFRSVRRLAGGYRLHLQPLP